MRLRWFRVEQEDQFVRTPYIISFLERLRVILETERFRKIRPERTSNGA